MDLNTICMNGQGRCGIYVYIHNGILLSHKKERNNAFAATWMQPEIIIPSEVSHKEKDKYNNI